MSKNVFIGVGMLMAGLLSCQDQPSDTAEATATANTASASIATPDTLTTTGTVDTSPGKPSIVSDAPLTNFTGVYSGVLPCADCEGIETQLTLNTDKTYSVSRKYLGKGDDNPFVTNGRWEWMSNNAMKLNNPSESPTLIYVMDGKVLMLDQGGNMINGSMADKYYLYKAQ
jgi:uncharacterized lipoprotein NlpE involved in copper resistance